MRRSCATRRRRPCRSPSWSSRGSRSAARGARAPRRTPRTACESRGRRAAARRSPRATCARRARAAPDRDRRSARGCRRRRWRRASGTGRRRSSAKRRSSACCVSRANSAIPVRAPQHLDDVPARAGEQRLQLLDDLAVAAHRTVEPLQVAVDDEGEVVELLARGERQRGDRTRARPSRRRRTRPTRGGRAVSARPRCSR